MSTGAVTERQHIYVWEAPVRIAHWIHVVAMLALGVSGFYIGNPFIIASGDVANMFIMAEMRLLHAVAAILLGLSFVGRFYWALVGNRYSRISEWLPLTRRKGRDLVRMVAYYTFLRARRPEYLGHNPVAGLTYFILYALVFIEGITGLALYAEYFPGGLWWNLFGWLWQIGAHNNLLRLIHHLLLWVFVVFFLIHLYLAILNDLIERSGINSSIVTGYKHPPVKS